MRIGPLGIWEILILLALILLVFGARRLPAIGRGMGEAIREFRRGVRTAVDGDPEKAPDEEARDRSA